MTVRLRHLDVSTDRRRPPAATRATGSRVTRPRRHRRWVLPKEAYTPWSTRLLAFLIDWTPIWLVFFVPVIGLLDRGRYGVHRQHVRQRRRLLLDAGSDLWLSVQPIAFLLAAVYFFWNFCYRQGKTGQSIGKSVMKFKVISEKTWQPIGFWLSLRAPDRPLCRPTHLLHRLSVSAVGRQASDDRRQDHEHRLRAVEPAAASAAASLCRSRTEVQRKALTPVSASPMTNWCTSDVPS